MGNFSYGTFSNRSMAYSLTPNNCEHFVKQVEELGVGYEQVAFGVAANVLGRQLLA